jgi:hypothetical protein
MADARRRPRETRLHAHTRRASAREVSIDMTLRMASRRKRQRWLGLAILVCTLSAAALSTTFASTVTSIPSNFFTVIDQQGPNDVNSDQVDLTQFGRDDTDATKYKLFWSWDSINSWTGSGQTGDACALFDTSQPGDGKIDKAVCARVTNVNADPNNVQIVPQDGSHPVFLFTCSNQKNDRCAQPTGPLQYSSPSGADAGVIGSLAKANLITDTDPFATGQSFPQDTTIEVDVLKSLVGNGVLVNVCSYPSAGNGGNNNPFDCIVTPGGGFLKIVKDAGSNTTTDFNFTVSPAPVSPQPSTYKITGSGQTGNIGIAITNGGSVTESVPSDWNLTTASCVKADGTTFTGTFDSANNRVTGIAIESGKLTTCTFTDRLKNGTLVVKKVVVNDNGGTKKATDFSFSVSGGAGTAFIQDTDASHGKNTLSLSAGTAFSVTEVGTPIAGYDTSYSGCTGTIAANTTSTCTITNDDQPATLIVKKVVVNDNGGSKHATDFSFSVNGGTSTAFTQDTDADHGKNTLTVSPGSYSVVESGLPITGYTTTSSACSGSIANGETKTCTITNNDIAGTLIVKKVVINDNGGSKHATDFGLELNGGSTIPFLQDTDADHGIKTLNVNAGSYSVDESSHAGYDKTLSSDCSGTIAIGETKTCTITNDDQAATLIVKKVVINDNGGSKHASNFSFSLNGGTATPFIQDTDADHGKNTVTVNAGSFSVVESGLPISGYSTSSSGCSGSIANGETKTCTMTNDDTKFGPTGSTTMGWKIYDSASFGIRAGAGDASSATITFRVYTDSDGVVDVNTCSAANQVGADAVISITLANSGATAGASSGDVTVPAGHYFWTATYSGDQYNSSASTACGSEVTTIQ